PDRRGRFVRLWRFSAHKPDDSATLRRLGERFAGNRAVGSVRRCRKCAVFDPASEIGNFDRWAVLRGPKWRQLIPVPPRPVLPFPQRGGTPPGRPGGGLRSSL